MSDKLNRIRTDAFDKGRNNPLLLLQEGKEYMLRLNLGMIRLLREGESLVEGFLGFNG